MRITRLLPQACCIAVICLGAEARAADVRVVRVFIPYELTAPPCVSRVGWSSQTTFHNTSETVQAVRLVAVSNGEPRPDAQVLILRPHQTVAVLGIDRPLHWNPVSFTPLWVNRLDVPDGVIVANRVEASIFEPYADDPLLLPCAGEEVDYIGLDLPVVKSLVPAGSPQYFFGTDVGGRNGLDVTDARLNIGVYNGGADAATAQVRVYCSSLADLSGVRTDLLLQTDRFAIASDTLLQKTVLASTAAARCQEAGSAMWHAVVTVDRPSFTYAIGMANGVLPRFMGTAPLAYTGQ